MQIGVLKEPAPERRVALLPEHASLFKKYNAEIFVEHNAGAAAFATDEMYVAAGANCMPAADVIQKCDLILCYHLPQELGLLKGKTLIGTFQPLYHQAAMVKAASSGVTVFSLDMLPRTTRAQSMDVLSSQANVAGYKAIVTAAGLYPKYFPMFMTAAGSIAPAKVLILGAGVAGLQAVATARRMGGVVEVFDTRPAVKEEVQSLGAKFIEVEGAADASKAGGYAVEQSQEFQQRQKEKIATSVRKADIVVTTAQIFGKKAPLLISKEMIESMKPGSVIIDIAASTGGNTELTRDNETVMHNGIAIVGNSNLPSAMPYDSSKMYGKNLFNFIELIVSPEGGLHFNFEDDLVKGACMVHDGKILNERLIN